jgi:hypothetical protein
LLEALFESGDYLQGENLRSLVGRRWCWSVVSFLEESLSKSLYFRCYVGGRCIVVVRSGII